MEIIENRFSYRQLGQRNGAHCGLLKRIPPRYRIILIYEKENAEKNYVKTLSMVALFLINSHELIKNIDIILIQPIRCGTYFDVYIFICITKDTTTLKAA